MALHGHRTKRGKKRISKKIGHLIKSEGKTLNQAAGQAFGQARAGDLGPAARRAAGRPKRGKKVKR